MKTANNLKSNILYFFVIFILSLILVTLLNNEDSEIVAIFEQVDKEKDAEFNLCMVNCGHWKTANFTNLSAKNGMGTCSAEASKRGFNQSVITYSFYGILQGGKSFFRGIEQNIELLQVFYPGWVVQVYHNIMEHSSVRKLCEVYCLNKDVLDICYAGDLPGFGNVIDYNKRVWRFFGLADPQIDYMMSRDLDSRFTERETAAVGEWLQSGAALHIMRDHPAHDTEMMAGMWDAKVADHLDIWRPAFNELINYSLNKSKYGEDETALKLFIFNKLGNIPGFLIQHDSYYCARKEYMKGKMRPYPTKRLNESRNFVGSSFPGQTVYKECPIPCRKNPDWVFC